MPRRGENIYKRKDGRWEGRVSAGPCGERKSFYGKSYKEVKGKMEDYKKRPPVTTSCSYNMKMACEIWMNEKRTCWKPTTCETYRQVLDKYIIPGLGNLKINEINDQIMENFKKGLSGNKETELSNNYQFYICALVSRIMVYMKKKHDCQIRIPNLPVLKNKLKKVTPPGEWALSSLEQYIWENKEEDTCLGIALAIYTGMRIGELCALKWEDINREEGVIYVRRNMQRVRTLGGEKNKTEMIALPPKTADSSRMIPIPPVLSAFLDEKWKESDGFVIKGVKNPWMDPRTLQYRFKRILAKCDIEYFNFHMLRHAFATRCVSMGFDTKSLSEILGHSSVQITLSLYIHPTMQQKKRLMDQFCPHDCQRKEEQEL